MPPLDDRDPFEWDEADAEEIRMRDNNLEPRDFWFHTARSTAFPEPVDIWPTPSEAIMRELQERSAVRMMQMDRSRATAQAKQAPKKKYHPNRDERLAKHSPKSDGERRTENVPLSNISL